MVAEGFTCDTRDENRMDNGHFLVRQQTTIINRARWLVMISVANPQRVANCI